ncbi:phosphonate C-P lyase system protein PhnH [Yersinia pestis subsp. pestis]|uniref:phosphonate C-P lyase system protein PhnH n=1 Tax=Yersinia pestis TaxID=632 RepID=UPI0018DB619B|nr:phosphonate C-P lyase system protein PhnH [Yersinia pestis subsp. pestis]
MSLLTHFDQPVVEAQYAFRRILKALSEPGVQVTLPHSTGWQPLNPATTSVLLTLADQETPLYLDSQIASEGVQHNLRFHTGAPLTADLATACFAVLGNELTEVQLATCPPGNELSPEQSVTVIIQVDSLNQGTPLRLHDPGIEQNRIVSPQLPQPLMNYLLMNHPLINRQLMNHPLNRPAVFPAGLDFLLTCGEHLMALPRTTHVEVC